MPPRNLYTRAQRAFNFPFPRIANAVAATPVAHTMQPWQGRASSFHLPPSPSFLPSTPDGASRRDCTGTTPHDATWNHRRDFYLIHRGAYAAVPATARLRYRADEATRGVIDPSPSEQCIL